VTFPNGHPLKLRISHSRFSEVAKREMRGSTQASRLAGSVVEDGQVELPEPRGVGDHLELDDLPASDCEGEDRTR